MSERAIVRDLKAMVHRTLAEFRPRTLSKRRVGRPRIATSEDIRGVLADLSQEGVRELPLAQFAHEISVRLNVSRSTAYRLINRAEDEGAIRTQGF